jgi:acid stress-induced BolA-like protein IbaG/YrbA
MQASNIEQLIRDAMPSCQVSVRGDDGRHFEAVVISAEFEGLTAVQQHRLVYRSLGDRMQTDEIHALALKTFTPAAWAEADSGS